MKKIEHRTVKIRKQAMAKRGASCPTCRRLNAAANRASSAYAIHVSKRNAACTPTLDPRKIARCRVLTKQCAVFRRHASAAHAAWRRHYSSCKK